MIKDKYLASIANFLHKSGSKIIALNPVFHQMPQELKLPAIYFPNPIVNSFNDTLTSFLLSYSWYVKIMAKSIEEAYEIAAQIQMDLCGNRFYIPILNEDGTADGNKRIRIKPPEIKQLDGAVYQISLNWEERNHYSEIGVEPTCVSDVKVSLSANGKITQYLVDDNGVLLIDDSDNILII